MIAQNHSLILHVLITLLSGYLFILFAVWWGIEKNATTLYKITCILMLGISQTHLGAVIAYLDYMDDGMIHVVDTWLWPCRHYLMVFSLVIYAFHITNKFRTSLKNKKLNLQHRREGD